MNTDDMVREALADLAPDAPADSSALAGFHRAIHRRRRRQTVARVAAAVAVLAMAVGAGALVLHAEDDPADFGTDEHGQDGKPTTDSTGTPKPDLGGRITFGEVSFQLPPGWEAGTPTKQTDPETGAEGDTMCIAPAGNEGRQFDGCAGLILHRGDFLPGNEMRPYQPHDNWAWSHSTDPPSCPTLGEPTADQPFDQAMAPDGTGVAPIDEGERTVGDRTAIYDRWAATCQSGFNFQPQAWYVPESHLLVFDIVNHPEAEDILASFEFED